MDARYADLETELCRIPEVTAARIVVNDAGKPTELHILALPDKHAKQVVRDIQSVAMASFGLGTFPAMLLMGGVGVALGIGAGVAVAAERLPSTTRPHAAAAKHAITMSRLTPQNKGLALKFEALGHIR